MGVLEGSLTINGGAKERVEICVFVLRNTLLGGFCCYVIAISQQQTSNNAAELNDRVNLMT